MDRGNTAQFQVSSAEEICQRNDKEIYRANDRVFPGPGMPADRSIQWNRTGEMRRREYRRHRFAMKYTVRDMELLARTDELHETLSGPATRKILQREYLEHGHQEYSNISMISVAHLYNMRRSNAYRSINWHYTKTKPTVVRIGERAKPDPKGQPGYIRADSVHQGDLNGQKGVYHINSTQ